MFGDHFPLRVEYHTGVKNLFPIPLRHRTRDQVDADFPSQFTQAGGSDSRNGFGINREIVPGIGAIEHFRQDGQLTAGCCCLSYHPGGCRQIDSFVINHFHLAYTHIQESGQNLSPRCHIEKFSRLMVIFYILNYLSVDMAAFYLRLTRHCGMCPN